MIDAATIRVCADAAQTQILQGVQAIHAGELLQAELHFSLAQQALLKLQRLLDAPTKPLRTLCLVGDREPVDPDDADISPWMAKKYDGGNGGDAA